MIDNGDNDSSDRLQQNAEDYYRGLFDAVIAGLGKRHLSHDSAVSVLLAVASAVAADLGLRQLGMALQQLFRQADGLVLDRSLPTAAAQIEFWRDRCCFAVCTPIARRWSAAY